KIKVMFIAQETNDWHGEFKNSIEYEIERYKNFWIDKKSPHSKKGPLMQLFIKFESNFDKKKVSCIWNNICKIGKAKDKGTPPTKIIEWQNEWFKIVKKEIEILHPDIIFFFTGPNKYDEFIKKSLGEFSKLEVEGFNKRAFSKLEFKDININAYKTYHPNYLRRSKRKDIIQKIEEIVKSL
ncbi:MAG: uracil-DNA glycosylase family protein, partial [Arcobacteraceae bacterium]